MVADGLGTTLSLTMIDIDGGTIIVLADHQTMEPERGVTDKKFKEISEASYDDSFEKAKTLKDYVSVKVDKQKIYELGSNIIVAFCGARSVQDDVIKKHSAAVPKSPWNQRNTVLHEIKESIDKCKQTAATEKRYFKSIVLIIDRSNGLRVMEVSCDGGQISEKDINMTTERAYLKGFFGSEDLNEFKRISGLPHDTIESAVETCQHAMTDVAEKCHGIIGKKSSGFAVNLNGINPIFFR